MSSPAPKEASRFQQSPSRSIAQDVEDRSRPAQAEQGEPSTAPSPSTLSMRSSPRGAQLQRQIQRQMAAIHSSDRTLQQQAVVHAIHSSPVAQAQREFFSKVQGAEAAQSPFAHSQARQLFNVAQREPEATPVKPDRKPIYHITTLENFQQIVARGGLIPLNWIIEGTHGQKKDERSTSRGLDSARGASEHETLEDHAREIRVISEAWKKSKGTDLEGFIAKRFADFKLGRKRDFVYGTKGGGTLSSYRDVYQGNKVPIESLVVLRWIQEGEDYYSDLEDSGAIKTLEGIPLGRLQVTQAIGIGDGRPETLEGLAWLPANDLELLVKAGLLPPPPPELVPQEPEEEALPSIEDLEGQIQQDEEGDDALIQQLEDELALEELEEELLMSELEESIERENAEDDQLIANLELELGPEVVDEIDQRLHEELAGEMEESARIDQLVARVLEETAPLLEQAHSIEEQLQIATDEAMELVDQSNQISEQLARPIQRQVIQREVIQCMYEHAEIDIQGVLDDIRGDADNEKDAETISKYSELDTVTVEQMNDVAKWMMKYPESVGAQLKKALDSGLKEFATQLLYLISNPPQEDQSGLQQGLLEQDDIDPDSPTFKELIAQAVQIHAPALGKLIDAAQNRATLSGKKLLVIVGEMHDDPYSRVMVTILTGALTRLGANRLYIESTPDLVKQHVEPLQENEPNKNDDSEAAHRQHFFHNIYKQGAPVIGVDVDKQTAGEEVAKTLGPRPDGEEEGTAWKAKYMEETIKLRNQGIAKAVTANPQSGVMLVGLSHLPGLQSDRRIQSAYEIVTVAAALPEAAVGRDLLAYGKILPTTDALTKMHGVYQGGKQELTPEVSAPDAYGVAEEMIIELNGTEI